jgi:benzylsuccinate CoA-transferase BbsE subunit
MFAVLDAEESGQGQLVDVSAQECVVMAHETAVQFWDSEKFIRRRAGGTERRAGHGVYPCKDGHIYLLVGMVGQFWGALIDWLEAEGAPEAEEFKDPKWREPDYVSSPEGRALFRERFLNFTMQRTKAELYETGKAARLPICPINTPADLVSFPQLEARDFYTTVEHATLGVPLKMPAAPFKLSETPYRVRQPAPTLGQHNAEVYGELGLTADDLIHLRSAGAI